MKQQVNLYLELPQKGLVFLPFKRMIQICLIFVIMLLIIYVILLFDRNFSAKRYNQQAQMTEEMQKKLDVFKEKFAQISKKTDANAEIAKLNSELQMKAKILEILNKQSVSKMGGYSKYLSGLAAHIASGVWLTQFDFTQGNQKAKLLGQAVRADAVLASMKSLTRDPIFAGLKLDLVEMKKPEKQTEPVTFVLSTKEVGKV